MARDSLSQSWSSCPACLKRFPLPTHVVRMNGLLSNSEMTHLLNSSGLEEGNIKKKCNVSRAPGLRKSGPGHIYKHCVTICPLQTTSKCGVSNRISMRPQCVLSPFTPVVRAVHLWSDHARYIFMPDVNKAFN